MNARPHKVCDVLHTCQLGFDSVVAIHVRIEAAPVDGAQPAVAGGPSSTESPRERSQSKVCSAELKQASMLR
jgi:hypothetical protein